MIGTVLAGLVAGYGVALPLGAIGSYLIGLGARQRFGIAAAAALGVASTDGIFAVLATVGGVGLAGLLRPVTTPLSYLAAAVLVLLAARTIARAVRPVGSAAGPVGARLSPLRSYLGLLALTAVNPATLIYFIAIVLGGQARGGAGTLGAAVLFPVGVFLASASWQLVLAGSGALLGHTLRGPAGQRVVAAASGAIMLGLAGSLLFG
ncbi:MAG TPA: LysE family transporter [Jatrophihabitans sp.]|nr:LysE family transporter [Jatrophihabitans sp.]